MLDRSMVLVFCTLISIPFVNIQDRIIVLVHCPFPYCYLSINQVSFWSLLYFPRYGPDRHPLWKKWLRGDYTVNMGRIMVLVDCPFSHCHLSTNQVSFKCQKLLLFAGQGTGRTVRRTKQRLYASIFICPKKRATSEMDKSLYLDG